MTEKIIRIEKAVFKRNNNSYSEYEGYQVITNKQTIKFGIENQQACCENWGYFMSEDDASAFIGAELFSIEKTDTELKTDMLKSRDITYLEDGGVMFITFKTSKGALQFVAYNEHNGYYGHEATIISEQVNVCENL